MEQEKRIKLLLKKHKGLIRKYTDTTTFKEPVVFLTRRNGHTEIYEDQKKPEFNFEHSDGKERTIQLDTRFLRYMDYGNNVPFKYYDCHEDYYTPLPEDPVVSSELVEIGMEKLLNDVRNWKSKEWTAKGDFIWKIAVGIVIIIIAFAVARLFWGDNTVVQQVPVVKTIVQNITPTII